MALGIYLQPHADYLVSNTNLLRFTFDGRYGGAQDKQVFIRNNETNKWYSSIVVQPVDNGGLGRVDGTKDGWECRLIAQDIQPLDLEWDMVTPGASVSIANIGSSTESNTMIYLPLWIRMQIKSNQPISTVTNIVLKINAKENLVA